MNDFDRNFLNWVSAAVFYIGYCRYGQINGHGFLVATMYEENEFLRDAVDDLSGGDIEAIQAAICIEEDLSKCFYATDEDPAKAMEKLMITLKRYYKKMNGEL
jgi:hypothetical protein